MIRQTEPRLSDKLGLAEYQAIEGFVRWRPGASDQAIDLAKQLPSARVLA